MRSYFTLATCLFLLLAFCSNGVAQVKHTLLYDSQMNITENKQHAQFIEVIERENDKTHKGTITLYKLSEDSLSGVILLKKGFYESIVEPRKAHGQLISYYENGKRESICTFNKGVQDGICVKWYDNGQVYYSIDYKNGLYHGELKSYYRDGKLKREDRYEEGKRLVGKCFNEAGEEETYFPFWQAPVFPGGEVQMLKYLSSRTRYPAEAQRNGISGLVVVQITVDAEGNVKNYTFAKKVHPSLDREALRVVLSMPKWVPGTIEGKAEEMQAFVPVKFTIR